MIKINVNSFDIFGKQLPFYGLLFIFGFALAVIVALINVKKTTLQKSEVVYSGIFAGVGGIIGAKLLSIITSIGFIIEYKPPLQDIIQNGFVFYGGLIGGVLGLLIYCKAYKVDFFKYSDLLSVGVPLGHAFGRIGCLFSGCCFGKVTSSGFSVIYLNSVDLNTPLNVPLIPIQLIEAICLIAIYCVCQFFFSRSSKKGLPTVVYGLCYSTCRFILEFFRGDDVRGVFFLSTSQYISIAIFILCCVGFKKIVFSKTHN